MISNILKIGKIAIRNQHGASKLYYNYITPVDKPVLSVAINSFVEMSG